MSRAGPVLRLKARAVDHDGRRSLRPDEGQHESVTARPTEHERVTVAGPDVDRHSEARPTATADPPGQSIRSPIPDAQHYAFDTAAGPRSLRKPESHCPSCPGRTEGNGVVAGQQVLDGDLHRRQFVLNTGVGVGDPRPFDRRLARGQERHGEHRGNYCPEHDDHSGRWCSRRAGW